MGLDNDFIGGGLGGGIIDGPLDGGLAGDFVGGIDDLAGDNFWTFVS